MNKISKLNKNNRKFIFDKSAFEIGVRPVIIEKDYWVCLILYFLFNISSFKDYFIFKGGTSLSKCYQVIDRFSEDIDLIIKLSSLGENNSTLLEDRPSKNQYNKYSDRMNLLCASFIKNTFVDKFKREFISFLGYDIEVIVEKDNPQTVLIYYPAIYQDEYIHSVIRLEIGPISLNTPVELKRISPYSYKYFPNEFKVCDFVVPIISIARTFFEKILILSNENNRPLTSMMPKRYSRHYYDVIKIYQSSYFSFIIKEKELFSEVKNFKSRYYVSSWSKYDEVSLSNIMIVPSNERIKELKQDYKNMQEMIFCNYLSFDELLYMLHKLEEELKHI